MDDWKAYREALENVIDLVGKTKALAEIAGVDIFDDEWGSLNDAEKSLSDAADQADLAAE